MAQWIKKHVFVETWSLKKRLSFISAFVLLVAFYIIYLVTQTAYINANKSRIQESLSAQIYSLMAVAEDRDAQLTLPEILRNDRLNNLNSGLVAYVLDIDGDLIWRSRSSDVFSILPDISLNYSIKELTESVIEEQSMFWIGEKIIWEHENNMEGEYLFLIGEKKSIMMAQVKAYKNAIATWLGVTTIILIIVLVIALNSALRPLKTAEQQIEQVSLGHADRVDGIFPLELIPLTSSINRLLESELLQKQRYRDTLGNLAHSLKTPLAIINSEIQKDTRLSHHNHILGQLERINDIVKYQLNRSVVTAGKTLQRQSKVKPEVEKIVEALKKVHAAKSLNINADLNPDCLFPGETGDLMELIGNISDNACKWAKTTVNIKVDTTQKQLVISIDDDGPGIPEDKRSLILNRGKRLDQQAEGQGLGLSIVMDIIKLYRGELLISQSQLGGALFIIKLPV